VLGQGVEDGSGEVAFEAAQGVHAALALGLFAREVVAGGRVQASLVDGRAVQCEVELAIATAVQTKAVGAPRGRRIGATPAARANFASVVNRSAPAVSAMSLAAVSGPQPGRSSSAGR
jgi:hypothetical protein